MSKKAVFMITGCLAIVIIALNTVAYLRFFGRHNHMPLLLQTSMLWSEHTLSALPILAEQNTQACQNFFQTPLEESVRFFRELQQCSQTLQGNRGNYDQTSKQLADTFKRGKILIDSKKLSVGEVMEFSRWVNQKGGDFQNFSDNFSKLIASVRQRNYLAMQIVLKKSQQPKTSPQ